MAEYIRAGDKILIDTRQNRDSLIVYEWSKLFERVNIYTDVGVNYVISETRSKVCHACHQEIPRICREGEISIWRLEFSHHDIGVLKHKYDLIFTCVYEDNRLQAKLLWSSHEV
jgi:hypothetical protein